MTEYLGRSRERYFCYGHTLSDRSPEGMKSLAINTGFYAQTLKPTGNNTAVRVCCIRCTVITECSGASNGEYYLAWVGRSNNTHPYIRSIKILEVS